MRCTRFRALIPRCMRSKTTSSSSSTYCCKKRYSSPKALDSIGRTGSPAHSDIAVVARPGERDRASG
ncbi:aspartate aminotransferase domain protein [Mycobacterium xenopi 3993]|nr:aspartate aminotransferase domain protein [Mycobacterium xenopi 3993]